MSFHKAVYSPSNMAATLHKRTKAAYSHSFMCEHIAHCQVVQQVMETLRDPWCSLSHNGAPASTEP